MKRRIRISESDLHRIVKESVKQVMREAQWAGSRKMNIGGQETGGQHVYQLDKNDTEAPGNPQDYHTSAEGGRTFKVTKDQRNNGRFRTQKGESRDRKIKRAVRESIKHVLKESETPLAWSQINSELGGYYPGDAQIVPFYSDETNICISVDNRAYQREGRTEIDNIMQEYGYRFYDAGGNGDRIMLTYKKA